MDKTVRLVDIEYISKWLPEHAVLKNPKLLLHWIQSKHCTYYIVTTGGFELFFFPFSHKCFLFIIFTFHLFFISSPPSTCSSAVLQSDFRQIRKHLGIIIVIWRTELRNRFYNQNLETLNFFSFFLINANGFLSKYNTFSLSTDIPTCRLENIQLLRMRVLFYCFFFFFELRRFSGFCGVFTATWRYGLM